MPQAAEDMKNSGRNKQDQVDFNRSRRFRGWRWNITERKSRSLEISVHRIDVPSRSSYNLHETAESTHRGPILTKMKARQTVPAATHSDIPLPPITGSRITSGKVENATAPLIHRMESATPKGYSTRLPTGNMMRNIVFHMVVKPSRKANQESRKHNQISVALPEGDKAAVQDSETTSGLIKQTFDVQPGASLTQAPVDPPLRHKKNDANDPGVNDRSTALPVKVKHDASLCKEKQQRVFCSDDSAIETESGVSEDKGRPERLTEDNDDEYYTDQRIAEWVLKVNSSLFSTGNDEMKSSKPAEEQDVATIKIIYTGD